MSIESQDGVHYGVKWLRQGVNYSISDDFENVADKAGLTTHEQRRQLLESLQAASRILKQWTDEGIGEIVFNSPEPDGGKRRDLLIEAIAAAAADPDRFKKTKPFTVQVQPAEQQPA